MSFKKSTKPAKKVSCRSKLGSHTLEKENKALIHGDLSTVPPIKAKADSEHQSVSIAASTTVLPKLHADALPDGWIKELVETVCEKSEAHPAAVLITTLLRFATEICEPFFRFAGVNHHCCTNAVIAGVSSKSRQGTYCMPVNRVFDEIPNKARSSRGHMSTGEGLINAVGDKKKEYDKISGKFIVTDHSISDNRLFFQEEEFSSALSYSKRGGNTLSPIVRGFFDDGKAEPRTKSSRMKTTEAHVVIVAHTTSIELASLLKTVQMPNSFANRFLWILVSREKLIARPKSMSEDKLDYFRNIIVKRINMARNLTAVKMSKDARVLWGSIYPGITIDVLGAAGNVVDLSEIHVLRLALIYALAAGHSYIKTEDLKAAHALVKYSRESASIIFKGDQGDKRKEKLLDALSVAANQEMTLTEISKVFGRNVNSDDLNKMVRELKESKLVQVTKETTDGAPKTIVRLARGMTTRDIQGHLQEIYGIDVSPSLISQVTDAISEEVLIWQNRPLDEVYPIVYLDAIRIKVRHDSRVINKAVYLAIGVNMDGIKEILGMWTAENEGAKFWLQVVTELKNRGVKDIFIACVDGLKGFPEAIESIFPKTQIQLCIVHMVRHSLNYVSWKQRKEVADDLKSIYQASTVELAERNLEAFATKWDSSHPSIAKSWRNNWERIIPLFSYPTDIRKAIYTTNAIESLNMSLRKVTKNRGHFPSDEAMFKLIYLALKNIAKKWTMPIRDWKSALNQFSIIFEVRMPKY